MAEKWKGTDASLSVCLNEYGMIYTYDGDDFNGWIAYGIDDNGEITTFLPFWMDNRCIDEYFEEDGEDIADMFGANAYDMDYEWKMDALIAYYGAYEFIDGISKQKSKDELVELIKKDGWIGNMDM